MDILLFSISVTELIGDLKPGEGRDVFTGGVNPVRGKVKEDKRSGRMIRLKDGTVVPATFVPRNVLGRLATGEQDKIAEVFINGQNVDPSELGDALEGWDNASLDDIRRAEADGQIPEDLKLGKNGWRRMNRMELEERRNRPRN